MGDVGQKIGYQNARTSDSRGETRNNKKGFPN